MNKTFLALTVALCSGAISCNKTVIGTAASGCGTEASGTSVVFGINNIGDIILTRSVSETVSLDSFLVVATSGKAGSETVQWNASSFRKKDGDSVYVADKFWSAEDPGYHFYASNAKPVFKNGKCTVSADGTEDIVCALLYNPEYASENKLSFSHIFARIGQVSIKAPENYTISDVSASIKCSTGGVYDIGASDGNGWTADAAADHALSLTEANDLYAVPGKYTLTVTYTLTRAQWSKTMTKSSDITLERGKINAIKGTAAGGDASDIAFSVSVEEWSGVDVPVEWN